MKYAKFKGNKTHASSVKSGDIGTDLWYEEYEVVACVGKYRQYWKYTNDKPILPNGYEPESEWHAAWKKAIKDDFCEVVCGENREHRADIKTDKFVIEIQKSPIDGWAVVERNKFYKNLTDSRVIWIVNIEKPWSEKRITTELVWNEKDGRFIITWKYMWKWVQDISNTTDTFLFLDFNHSKDKLTLMWTHNSQFFGKWVLKETFFNQYLKSVAKEEYETGQEEFLNVFSE
ncbi:competence protein CoiA family protein [Flavobacterium psychrophilum]|uniref:hypothetical protein n=1 Tax=Flavobacterium psychrophilum TaxID=96345 RepID=UPI000B7C52C4|nr:hypothetical protein [Flavobacterium psychrophilum]MBF2024390.1 hypothetical protein [Flavobacterium psychrophilum]MCB5984130.1 hypothetical protein [Flavobacterium psychrophilum]MCB5994127.1 hypothetical protein [Flavobacterium psychrophilum]MCB5997059.1 hypothetical protein [Flavobacterium psychrophilum]MCB6004404.1 hypothetical protein [Flavobacterium psychrophilum]